MAAMMPLPSRRTYATFGGVEFLPAAGAQEAYRRPTAKKCIRGTWLSAAAPFSLPALRIHGISEWPAGESYLRERKPTPPICRVWKFYPAGHLMRLSVLPVLTYRCKLRSEIHVIGRADYQTVFEV